MRVPKRNHGDTYQGADARTTEYLLLNAVLLKSLELVHYVENEAEEIVGDDRRDEEDNMPPLQAQKGTHISQHFHFVDPRLNSTLQQTALFNK